MLTNTTDVVNAVKYAVKARGTWAKFVAENPDVTRENIADTARALATLAYPADKMVQTETVDGKKVRTRYGNAVQAAGNGLRSVLDKAESEDTTPDYLAAVIKAATKAIDHEVDAAAVRDAVNKWAEDVLS